MIYAARYETMNSLLAFLTENCCQGAPDRAGLPERPLGSDQAGARVLRLFMFEHCSLCFRVRMTAALKRLHLQETVVLDDDSDDDDRSRRQARHSHSREG